MSAPACDPALDTLALVARGEEDVARAKYGDEVVDAAIAESLAAEGWDLALCVAHGNGYGS